jgi:hypothetical protein
MQCWEDGELTKPWETLVIYNLALSDIEPSPKRDATVTVETDDCGDRIVMKTTAPLEGGISRATLSAGEHLDVRLSAYTVDTLRRNICPRAVFDHVRVEKFKELHYSSPYFRWCYRLTIRWSTPSLPKDSIGHTAVAKSPLVFLRDPTFHVEVSCIGYGKTHITDDAVWFTDSALCKLLDLLPPPRCDTKFPFRLKDPGSPPQSTVSIEEVDDEGEATEAWGGGGGGDGDDDDEEAAES